MDLGEGARAGREGPAIGGPGRLEQTEALLGEVLRQALIVGVNGEGDPGGRESPGVLERRVERDRVGRHRETGAVGQHVAGVVEILGHHPLELRPPARRVLGQAPERKPDRLRVPAEIESTAAVEPKLRVELVDVVDHSGSPPHPGSR